jgi:hypothetical protein
VRGSAGSTDAANTRRTRTRHDPHHPAHRGDFERPAPLNSPQSHPPGGSWRLRASSAPTRHKVSRRTDRGDFKHHARRPTPSTRHDPRRPAHRGDFEHPAPLNSPQSQRPDGSWRLQASCAPQVATIRVRWPIVAGYDIPTSLVWFAHASGQGRRRSGCCVGSGHRLARETRAERTDRGSRRAWQRRNSSAQYSSSRGDQARKFAVMTRSGRYMRFAPPSGGRMSPQRVPGLRHHLGPYDGARILPIARDHALVDAHRRTRSMGEPATTAWLSPPGRSRLNRLAGFSPRAYLGRMIRGLVTTTPGCPGVRSR